MTAYDIDAAVATTLAAIEADIAAGLIPNTVTSMGDIELYRDANSYYPRDVPFGPEHGTAQDPDGVATLATIERKVDESLAARLSGAPERTEIRRMLHESMNGWTAGFFLAAAAIARAVADGRISEDAIRDYPLIDNPREADAIARAAGLTPETTEDVTMGVCALRSIMEGTFGEDGDGYFWYLEEQEVAAQGFTLETLNRSVRGMSAVGAARLILDRHVG